MNSINQTACADFPTGVELADDNCVTYLLTDVVAWPTVMPATPTSVDFFS